MSAEARPMKYPYTYSAKIAQFPYRFYLKHCWLIRWTLYGAVVALPIMYKIQKLSYSPENVKVWDEKTKELFTKHEHH